MSNIENIDSMLKENERIDELGIDDLKIIQNTKYFCFGIDSVLLANFVNSNSSKSSILDLCSGSGVIPILLSSKVKYSRLYAVELQEEMFDLLDRNIVMNSLEEKIKHFNCDVNNLESIKNNLYNISGKYTVDIITVNPPYKPKNTGVINEDKVKHIARHEEKCTLRDVLNISSKLLTDNGKLYLVHKPERLVDLLDIAREYKLEAKKIRFVYPRVDSNPSIVLVQYSKNGGNEIKVLPPLIEYDIEGNYTQDIYNIYGWKGSN
ncbi:N5-glutamine S-adenosyl-L-methionine-dependent methyltransferase [compost metagenome]